MLVTCSHDAGYDVGVSLSSRVLNGNLKLSNGLLHCLLLLFHAMHVLYTALESLGDREGWCSRADVVTIVSHMCIAIYVGTQNMFSTC